MIDSQALAIPPHHVRALVVFGVVFLAACGGGSSTDPKDGEQESYRNEVWEWTASYPAGWALEDKNSAVLTLTTPVGHGDTFVVVISADWHPSASRIDMLLALVASYEESLDQNGVRFRELSRRQFTTVAQMPAAEVLYELGADATGKARLVILTTMDRRAFTLNVEADSETYALLEPGFDLLVDSFNAE